MNKDMKGYVKKITGENININAKNLHHPIADEIPERLTNNLKMGKISHLNVRK